MTGEPVDPLAGIGAPGHARHDRLIVRVRQTRPLESARRSGLMALIGVLSQGAIRFIASFAIGIQAGAGALGIFAAQTSLAQLLSLFWPTTNGSAASKYVAGALGRESVDDALAVTHHLTKRTAQSLVPLVATGWAYGYFGLGLDPRALLSISFLLCGLAAYLLVRGVLFGLGRVTRSAVSDVATSLMAIVGIAVLLALGVDTTLLLLPMAFCYLAYAAMNYPWGHDFPKIDPQASREVDKFVGLAVAGSVASSGFLQMAMLVAKHFGNSDGAGQFAAALTLATPLSLLGSTMVLVLLPRMSRTLGEGGTTSLVLITDKTNHVASASMVVLFTPAVIAGPALSQLFWPEEFSDVSSLIPMLLFAVLANSLGIVCVNALVTRSFRTQRLMTLACYAGMALGVGTWIIAIPWLGVTGVAWGYLVGTAAIAFFAVVLEWRLGAHHWRGLYLRVSCAIGVQAAVVTYDQFVDASVVARLVQSLAIAALFTLGLTRDLRAAVTAAAD